MPARQVLSIFLGYFLLFSNVHAADEAPADMDAASFRIGLGLSKLKFVDAGAKTTNSRFAILDFGMTKGFDRLFVSFDTELPFSQGADNNYDQITQVKTWDLTLGYTFPGNVSLFGGYHYAQYDFFRTSFAVDYYGTVTGGGSDLTRHLDEGYYLGLGYGFRVGETGGLSFSVARGDFDSRVTTGPGRTTGNSYSVRWSDDFRYGRSYYVKFRLLDYRFDLDPEVVTTFSRSRQKDIWMLATGIIF